jgi:hypothetical protein
MSEPLITPPPPSPGTVAQALPFTDEQIDADACQSQPIDGDDAVLLIKSELARALSSMAEDRKIVERCQRQQESCATHTERMQKRAVSCRRALRLLGAAEAIPCSSC